MKKIFVITALAFVHQYSFAQSKIGITVGTSNSNIYLKIGNEKQATDPKFGFTAGLIADIPITKNVSLQPLINFTQKGAIETMGVGNEKATVTINMNYLEMPINIIYHIKSGSSSFFCGGGPSISIGLSGKAKYDYKLLPGWNETEKINFGSSADDVKSFDAGLNATVGLLTKSGFLISVNYTHGFSNLLNYGDNPFFDFGSDERLSNRYVGLRIGYLLHTKTASGKK